MCVCLRSPEAWHQEGRMCMAECKGQALGGFMGGGKRSRHCCKSAVTVNVPLQCYITNYNCSPAQSGEVCARVWFVCA